VRANPVSVEQVDAGLLAAGLSKKVILDGLHQR
jgi:hypothetical protein